MTFFNVILLVLLVLCIKMVKDAIIRFHRMHALDITVRDFIENYYKYQDVWDTDYDAEKVLKICNQENNFIQIGILSDMNFQNTEELRKCMLKAGEFIIKYSEVIQDTYGYMGDEDEFNSSLEMLREIRRICIQKGEKSFIEIRIN